MIDPYSGQTIFGMKLVVVQSQPRYVLPADVPPPTGMTREEFASWSIRFCGRASSSMKDGQLMVQQDTNTIYMNERTFASVKAELAKVGTL